MLTASTLPSNSLAAYDEDCNTYRALAESLAEDVGS